MNHVPFTTVGEGINVLVCHDCIFAGDDVENAVAKPFAAFHDGFCSHPSNDWSIGQSATHFNFTSALVTKHFEHFFHNCRFTATW